jgi:hypothetical protein
MPDAEVKLLSIWLHEELAGARVRRIRVKDVEVEVNADTIYKAICENLEYEDGFMAPSDEGQPNPPTRQSLVTTPISEADVVSSQAPFICLRIPPGMDAEEYVQGSAIQECSHCQSDVLVSPSTQATLAQGKYQIVCMECWAEAQKPGLSPEERHKLLQLEICKQAGEQAYDDMYEKAHHPSDAAAYYSNAKESFYTAIGLARELGLDAEAERLEERLAHIKSVFRGQF